MEKRKGLKNEPLSSDVQEMRTSKGNMKDDQKGRKKTNWAPAGQVKKVFTGEQRDQLFQMLPRGQVKWKWRNDHQIYSHRSHC